MKASFIGQIGPSSIIQFGDLARPEPRPGQALVRIHAAAVNPVDLYIRRGSVKMDLPLPYIPGSDFAGVVEAVNGGKRGFKAGDRVWGSNQGWFGRQGTMAEYAVIDEGWLYPMPAKQTFAQAAAGALTGITAHLGLFSRARLRPGEIVFVNGGSGGVGSAVIQLAKWSGAHVIATAGDPTKRALCEKWGADLVLDYNDPMLRDRVREFANDHQGVQVWFETNREPNFRDIIELMAPGGRIVLIAGGDAEPALPIGAFYFKDLSLQGLIMMKASADEQRQSASVLNACYIEGKWQPAIGRLFPLTDVEGAQALQEENTLRRLRTVAGKIVVTTDAI